VNLANQTAFDRYSLVHAGVGYAVGRAGVPWRVALTWAVAFELLEDELKDKAPGLFPRPSHDSTANKVSDVAIFLVGYALATPRGK
jgi:hypothetical protein